MLLALGSVALLIAGMIGFDVVLGQRVAMRTNEIIENSQRSIELLDGIRADAQALSVIGVSDLEARRLGKALVTASRDYDPLTTCAGERAEWARLRAVLRQLTDEPRDEHVVRSQLANDVDSSVDRLVLIKWDSGRANAIAIRAAHRQAIWGDVVVGAIALGLVTIISVVLIRALARQRLLVAERLQLLDGKNSDLEAFVGRAAHDLRAPMSPIRGYAELLLESSESPEEVRMLAERIRVATDRMAHVVDDMLALSTAGCPEPGLSSSAEVVATTIAELRTELLEVTVSTTLAGGQVACSSGVLGQILRNLIDNSIKFRDHERPLTLTIETRDVGSMVAIMVEDNGIGMDSETIDHAFDPRYRGHLVRPVPGHGLGLAIVQRTSLALGGTCELWSAADRGTRIVVRLPRA